MEAAATPAEPAARVPLLSRMLIAAVAALTVVALLGAWVDRQLLNSEDWRRTSAALLGDEAIRGPVADAIAGQIADGSRASGAVEELGSMLPPQLQPVADAASGLVTTATRSAVQDATRQVLANGRVQDAWVDATLIAQQALVLLIQGDDLDQDDGTIHLDLRSVAAEVAQELGYSVDRVQSLPADRTEVALMSADRLRTLQRTANALDALSWLPGALALLLAAAAIEVARGARRATLSAIGTTLIGSALVALVLQRLAGHAFVEAVTDGGPMKGTADATWSIAGDLLVALCVVLIVIGALIVGGAWLAGAGGRAVRVRGFLRPPLTAHPALAYGTVAFLYLAAVAWGPLTGFARAWPIVMLGALLAVGLLVLHRRVVAPEDADPPAPQCAVGVAGADGVDTEPPGDAIDAHRPNEGIDADRPDDGTPPATRST